MIYPYSHANAIKEEILLAMQKAKDFKHQHKHHKTRTKSNELFFDLLQKGVFFDIPKQKKFLDINSME